MTGVFENHHALLVGLSLSSEVPIFKSIEARVTQMRALLVSSIEAVLSTHREACVPNPNISAQLIVDTVDALTHRWVIDGAGNPMAAEELREALVVMVTHYVTHRDEE